MYGAWRFENIGWGYTEYIVFSDGTYAFYSDNFCEGAIAYVGKWLLEENSIIFNQTYSFVIQGPEQNTTRLTVDTKKHALIKKDDIDVYKREYWEPKKLESTRKWIKPYINAK